MVGLKRGLNNHNMVRVGESVDDQMDTLGDRIRELREDMGMSGKAFSAAMSVTASAVSQWELNKTLPDFAMLERIADFFRVSTDYLLVRTDDKRILSQIVTEAVDMDPELKQFWHVFLSRQDLRVAFRTLKDLTPETLRQVVRIAKVIETDEGELGK